MIYQFSFVLYWLIPQLKKIPEEVQVIILEKARKKSRNRIQKYAGWILISSLSFSFAIFFLVPLRFLLIENIDRPIILGALTAATVLSSSFLYAIANAVLIKPAVKSELEEGNFLINDPTDFS